MQKVVQQATMTQSYSPEVELTYFLTCFYHYLICKTLEMKEGVYFLFQVPVFSSGVKYRYRHRFGVIS